MLEHEESNKRRHRMMSMLIIDICDGVKKESLRRIKHNADRKSGTLREGGSAAQTPRGRSAAPETSSCNARRSVGGDSGHCTDRTA